MRSEYDTLNSVRKEEEKEKRDGALGTTASEEKEAAAMLEMKRLFAREKVLDVALKAVDDVMEGGTLLEQQKEEMQRIKMAKAALKTLVGKRGLLQACVEVRQGQTYRKEV